MPRAARIAPRLAKGLSYVTRYGGYRGPVAHLTSVMRAGFTVCGLPIRIGLGGGSWGSLSADIGHGHHLCKNCDSMKDADSVVPRKERARP